MKNETDVLQMLQSRIGSADWSQWQMQRWCFYDYIRYPTAGTTQLTFFANALGATDPVSNLGKTAEQTNVSKSRSFGQVYFIIQQIRSHIHFLPKARQVSGISSDADLLFNALNPMWNAINNLSGQGVLTIKIGQKEYFDVEQPFRFCPPGFGIELYKHASSYVQADSDAQQSWWWQQSPDPKDVYSMTPPQMIEPEQTIEVTIDFPNGVSPALTSLVNSVNPAVDIGLIFDGYIARPVQ